MKKIERQRLLRQLIKEHRIQKQEEFVELLNEQGVEVTQATVSRDIKEMNLIKVSQADGSFFYSLREDTGEPDRQRLNKMLKQSVISVALMDKYISLKIVPGSAVALGIVLESIYEKALFTLITTDDKVLMIFFEEEKAAEVSSMITQWLYG